MRSAKKADGHISRRGEAMVLIVDDDEHVRRALKRVLKRTACRLVEAGDAKEALQQLESQPVHVVVSDHRMPGMSGVELLGLVKRRWPRIQRVLLTGQADTAAIEEAVNGAEIFRFIWKPWDDAHLLLTIQSAIDQHWLIEENRRLSDLLAQRHAELELINRDLEVEVDQRSRALARAADEWRACFDSLSDPLAVIGEDRRVLQANAAFARAVGISIEQVQSVVPAAPTFRALPWADPSDSTEPVTMEVGHGDRTWLVRTFPLPEGGMVILWKDVTEEREVTRRLLQADKMAAVGQLAGGVAHEINNPLAGILAFAQVMAQEERCPSDAESLWLIQDAARRAKRIVDSLLRFSRQPREDERAEVDLVRLVEETLLLMKSELAGIQVVRHLAPARAMGNGNQIQQIVMNLLGNAVHAVKRDGRITVTTSDGPPGHVRLVVTDDGPGVPPAIAGRIFEPFFTTKPEGQGTGLGLPICYRIAEEHGGSIRYEPGPGGGASFLLEIPAFPRKKPRVSSSAPHPLPRRTPHPV